jgi:hypothetical protein
MKTNTALITKMNEMRMLESWYERNQGRISHFEINLRTRKIEDAYGEAIMPITPEIVGVPENVLVKQLYQQIGG